MKFSPATIEALKDAEPRIKRLHPATLLVCLAAIERHARDLIACSCDNAAECAAYDPTTHTITRHGQPVLRAEWFPERRAGEPTGPLKISRLQ